MFFKKDKVKEWAKQLLMVAEKIEHYRGDVLTPLQQQTLNQARNLILSAWALPIKEASGRFTEADQLLKTVGGTVYPATWWVDNAEVFLFAAVLALAIRTFFFQPFKIPTNSMYPTYAGMKAELVTKERNWLQRLGNWVCFGSTNYRAKVEREGALQIPIATRDHKTGPYGGILHYQVIQSRKIFGLLASQEREYTFLVGGEPIQLRVPLEFNFDEVALKTLFPGTKSWSEILGQQSRRKFHRLAVSGDATEDEILYFDTGIYKGAEEDLFNFDIMSGDMLFVNKLAYHFSRPKVGDPIVFRTRDIERLNHDDKYYIKRLVGLPGDTLAVEDGDLYRNGKPIEGAEAFKLNRGKVGEYPGYTNIGSLEDGSEVRILENEYFAMGDNSPDSYDSRAWGGVPRDAVIGKAIFILYPFTHRWGVSR